MWDLRARRGSPRVAPPAIGYQTAIAIRSFDDAEQQLDPPATEVGALAPGDWVEVCGTLEQRWAVGFVVEAIVEGGYVLRRDRDQYVLPGTVRAERLRLARGMGSSRLTD